METKSLIVGGGIGLVVGYLIFGIVFGGDGTIQNGMRGERYMMGNIDKHFIEQMIPHHEGAIEMAQLALEKAQRSEIKSLATAIIAAQQKEIVDMRSWYEQWFGAEVPMVGQHMMNGHMMGGGMTHMNSMSGDMEVLKNAKDFDLEFARQMIPHHEMAVMMAQMLLSTTDRSEMKTLAQNIITSQNQEIEMMRGWIAEWSK